MTALQLCWATIIPKSTFQGSILSVQKHMLYTSSTSANATMVDWNTVNLFTESDVSLMPA
jgi:hypothetical protein